MFIRLQENLLGDVFGFGGFGKQAHGSAEHHVLVVMQERLELLRIGHGVAATGTVRARFYIKQLV
jgi:hypothetical protein